MKLTVDAYSQKFKMSKEMIKSKIKAKRLSYIVDNEIIYIVVPDEVKEIKQETKEVEKAPAKAIVKQKTTVATVIALYQKENLQLKEKISQLEEKIDKLIDDKEQMLRDEMQKIEQVYSAKDDQLKTILELVNKKMTLDNNATIHEIETISPSKKEEKISLIELKDYLKTLDLKSYQRKIIKKRFLAVHDSDIRIIQQNGKLFLDFSTYDYSDLLEY